MRLFNLEMEYNDPLKLVSKIKVINHEIESTGVKVDLQLIAFIKSLYLGYSHYWESLQAFGKLKDLDFDELVGKIVEREKDFRKKEPYPILMMKICVLLKKIKNLKKNQPKILRVAEGEVGGIIEAGGEYLGR